MTTQMAGLCIGTPSTLCSLAQDRHQEEFVNRETGEHYEDLNQMLRRIDETRTWIPELKVWQVVNPPA